ncbi:MAG: hypothetical protein LBH36_01995 [Candidatus Nomurabacteria bacterium]|jgi:hypothetical membrane protein|nr:hypothetical protein [Candidatus Nomurabacteria bacterium]
MVKNLVSNWRLSSYKLTYVLIAVMACGLVLSMFLTEDPRWMEWHLSRLGEGMALSSAIFNFSITIGALLLAIIAMLIADDICAASKTKQAERGARILRDILLIVAVCWLGVGCFPFDRFPIIHNCFGYGEFFLLGGAMLALHSLYSGFSKRTYSLGIAAVLVTGVLMILFHLVQFTTLLAVELIGQLFTSAWLLLVTYDTSKRSLGQK